MSSAKSAAVGGSATAGGLDGPGRRAESEEVGTDGAVDLAGVPAWVPVLDLASAMIMVLSRPDKDNPDAWERSARERLIKECETDPKPMPT